MTIAVDLGRKATKTDNFILIYIANYQQCRVLQKIAEFKDFQAFECFPVLFIQGRFNLKDVSSMPSKFKYFSSKCEPCLKYELVYSKR